MKVCCVFLLESPHGVQYVFNIKKRKSPEIILNLQLWDFFKKLKNEFEIAVGIRAISVRATEVLLYFQLRQCPGV